MKFSKIYFLLVLNFALENSYSQTVDSLNWIYNYETEISFYGKNDDKLILITSESIKNIDLDKEVKIDNDSIFYLTTDRNIKIKDIISNKSPLILFIKNPVYEGYDSQYEILYLDETKFDSLKNIRGYILDIFDDELLYGDFKLAKYDGYGDYIDVISTINLKSKENTDVFKTETNNEMAEGIVSVLGFNSDVILFRTSYCYTPLKGCDSFKNFVFRKGMIKPLDAILKNKEILFSYKDNSAENFLIKTYDGFFKLSSDGQVTSVLNRSFKVIGWNYKNNNLVSYSVHSILDKPKYKTSRNTLNEVIIPFELNFLLEECFSLIIEGKLLNEEILNDFEYLNLRLLKGMIYAKHNYKFSNEYLQAYFNLFEFYNNDDLRNERRLDIFKYLTEIDKLNLKLINDRIN